MIGEVVPAGRTIRLLADDTDRFYLWKPPGLPVFPPHADPQGDCVLRQWLTMGIVQEAGWPQGFEGGIAHRLDNATSGLLLVARSPDRLPALRQLFQDGALRKFYLFRASVPPPFAARVIEVPLAHHPRKKDRMVWQRGPRTDHRGRWYPAWTELRARDDGWWRAEIRTGVMHQVRVHATYAGVALDGDAIYAPPERRDLPFCLHHQGVVAPGWASPEAPLPAASPDPAA